jgi:tetratricopeptide (TPR) repeat protein
MRKIARLNADGLFYSDCGMWDEAIVCFRKAVQKDSHDVLSHYHLGYALYHGKKNTTIAHEEFLAALKEDPNMAEAYYLLGHLQCHARGNRESGEKNLYKALDLFPGCAAAHNTLGTLAIADNNWEKAFEWFTRAITANPSFDSAYSNASIACVYLGRMAQAEKYAVDYVRLQSASALAHNNLGNVYGAIRKYQEAIKEFKESLVLNPNDWMVHFWLGCLYLQIQDFTQAIKSFHCVLQNYAGHALSHYNLALSYEALKMKDNAREHIDKAIALNPKLGENFI